MLVFLSVRQTTPNNYPVWGNLQLGKKTSPFKEWPRTFCTFLPVLLSLLFPSVDNLLTQWLRWLFLKHLELAEWAMAYLVKSGFLTFLPGLTSPLARRGEEKKRVTHIQDHWLAALSYLTTNKTPWRYKCLSRVPSVGRMRLQNITGGGKCLRRCYRLDSGAWIEFLPYSPS